MQLSSTLTDLTGRKQPDRTRPVPHWYAPVPALKRERSASPIFTRTQVWRCGTGEALVIFSADEARCSVFLMQAPKGISAESLFAELDLAYRPWFALVPSIDCHAIGCPSEDVTGLLNSLATCMA